MVKKFALIQKRDGESPRIAAAFEGAKQLDHFFDPQVFSVLEVLFSPRRP